MKKTLKDFAYNTSYKDIQQKIINEQISQEKVKKNHSYIFIPILASLAIIAFVVSFTSIKLAQKNNISSNNIAINPDSSDKDDNNDDGRDDDTYLGAEIPETIIINNKIYNMIDESDNYKSNQLIGFITNSIEKVEILKNKNQNSNLFYIVDDSYYDKDADSTGEIYSIVNYDNLSIIGLHTSANWMYYKISK